MEIRPIRTDADHESAVREIEALWGAEANTPEGDRLDVLITLADAYEDKRWPVPAADPVEAIKNSMAMEGRNQTDLAKLLGSAPRASEILRRQRSLTLPMIWELHDKWHIPADVLVQPYETVA